MMLRASLLGLAFAVCGCGALDGAFSDGGVAGGPGSPNGFVGGGADLGAAGGNGGFGNVGVGGGQDFAAFRQALDHGQIPSPGTLDSTGFFAEHYTTLPAPSCGQTFCLHGLLGVAQDLAHGGSWTLLQMGMSSPVDPSTVKKPPLDVAVVLDHSGSMAEDNKLTYARLGVKQLIEALGSDDVFTFIAFDDKVSTLFGPAKVIDKAALEAQVDAIAPGGGTNIYDALETGYKAVLSAGDETQQRRVIFLTDGLPTVGDTDHAAIATMSAGYNNQYVGLSTIGLGGDVDAPFLRGLAETAGGNFYFIDQPSAVMNVFAEELAYFVAPIAYDVDLTFDEQPYFAVKEVFGTHLWQKTATGGAVHVPSVFLVSRQSTDPSPTTGGRRGGGAAIIAQLDTTAAPSVTGTYDVAQLHLRYRLPGGTSYLTQDVPVSWSGVPGQAPDGGYFSDPSLATNDLILAFYVAFRDATAKAVSDPKAALTILTDFRPRIGAALMGSTDADLLDDLRLLDEYIAILTKA